MKWNISGSLLHRTDDFDSQLANHSIYWTAYLTTFSYGVWGHRLTYKRVWRYILNTEMRSSNLWEHWTESFLQQLQIKVENSFAENQIPRKTLIFMCSPYCIIYSTLNIPCENNQPWNLHTKHFINMLK